MKRKSNLKLDKPYGNYLRIDNHYPLFNNDLSSPLGLIQGLCPRAFDLVCITSLFKLNYNLSKSERTLSLSNKNNLSTSTKGVKRLTKKEREEIHLTDKEKEVLVGLRPLRGRGPTPPGSGYYQGMLIFNKDQLQVIVD